MGLYDRDYYRRSPPPGDRVESMSSATGARGLGMLSMNTWLIAACVLVYVVNLMFAPQPVPISHVTFFNERYQQIDPRLLILGPPQNIVDEASGKRVRTVAVVFERNSGAPVGQIDVIGMRPIEKWLHFSTQKGFLEFEFWRFIGFQFLHANIAHLVVNMIGLFFFGPLVEAYLGSKRYLAFYLLCGIFGAIMYMLLNLIGYIVAVRYQVDSLPFLLFSDTRMPLVGASAGIFGVLIAGAYLAPRETVYLFFVLPMQLRTVAYLLVGVALLTLLTSGQNAGGEASHLGGAIAGYYFIRHTHHLHNFFDVLGRVDPTSHHYRKGAAMSPSQADDRRRASRLSNPQEVDRILEKISREGVQSLTADEKRTLAQGRA